MKKLLVIAIALFAIGSVYAQTFNPTVPSGNKTVTTKVITPLTITVDNTAPRDFGNLIQGQERIFTTPTPICLFQIHRELNQPVNFTVYEPTPAGTETGVTLNTKVYKYTGNWGTQTFAFAPNTALNWGDGSGSHPEEGGTLCNVAIVVEKATAAPTAFLGAHTFNVHIMGQYVTF